MTRVSAWYMARSNGRDNRKVTCALGYRSNIKSAKQRSTHVVVRSIPARKQACYSCLVRPSRLAERTRCRLGILRRKEKTRLERHCTPRSQIVTKTTSSVTPSSRPDFGMIRYDGQDVTLSQQPPWSWLRPQEQGQQQPGRRSPPSSPQQQQQQGPAERSRPRLEQRERQQRASQLRRQWPRRRRPWSSRRGPLRLELRLRWYRRRLPLRLSWPRLSRKSKVRICD
ncbi:hypothetical protein BR93DRAFT_143921 [Coniochaeta sp. PMI_546]|nr:hypothetical protein BR93DRAFT_143921 [Coniochaeta sp. PMI_546]